MRILAVCFNRADLTEQSALPAWQMNSRGNSDFPDEIRTADFAAKTHASGTED
jgi:hypothetical protein